MGMNAAELFEAVQALRPRQRLLYQAALAGSVAAAGVTGAAVIAIGSLGLAYGLIDTGVSREGLLGAVILPTWMAYAMVLAVLRFEPDPAHPLGEMLRQGAWRSGRAGLAVGVVVVALAHFIGQLAMARALYGALHYHRHVLSYCGVVPVVYALVFALPVAAGCALFGAWAAVSGEAVYHWVKSRTPPR